MLTRAQVARLLGKSIATVRRVEGIHLFPRTGIDGIHRFDRNEVEVLAREIRNGIRLPSGLNARPPNKGHRVTVSSKTPVQNDDLAQAVHEMGKRLATVEAVLAELIDELA